MNLLYVGQYQDGSTSKMRGEILARSLMVNNYFVIDTNQILAASGGIIGSFGWRFNRGPLVTNINKYIRENLAILPQQDIIWVDKGVFIDKKTTELLREKAKYLIHYTPDTAFSFNRSKHFFQSIAYYDWCVTTKSFELDDYQKAGAAEVIFCTQGYDRSLHRPYNNFDNKSGIIFVGLAEPYRIEILDFLVKNDLPVKLGGVGWRKFIDKNKKKNNLIFLGDKVYGHDYASEISRSLIGLGFLSKKFPELHTTRTLEVPACGTALATEINSEVARMYRYNEAIFFTDRNDLAEKLFYYLQHKDELAEVTIRGTTRVLNDGYDYKTILENALRKMGILK